MIIISEVWQLIPIVGQERNIISSNKVKLSNYTLSSRKTKKFSGQKQLKVCFYREMQLFIHFENANNLELFCEKRYVISNLTA